MNLLEYHHFTQVGEQQELVCNKESGCVHVVKGGGFVHTTKEPRVKDNPDCTIHIGERTSSAVHTRAGFRLVEVTLRLCLEF